MAELKLVSDEAVPIVLSDRALVSILCEVDEMAPVETGGLLLGAWRDGRCYVVESIDPGPNSIFQMAYFEYDRPYTEHLINKIARLYEAKLTLVGLWHRHPGSFDQFSGTDDTTNAKFASLAPEGAISALVNVDPDFRLTFFHATLPLQYVRVAYEVGDDLIPPDLLAHRDTQSLRAHLRAQALGDASGPQRAAQPKEVPGMRLGEVMEQCVGRLRELAFDELTDTRPREEDDSCGELVEATLDDLLWLGDDLGVRVKANTYANKLVIAEEGIRDARELFILSFADKLVLEYEGRRYHYEPGLLKKAYEDRSESLEPGSDSEPDQEADQGPDQGIDQEADEPSNETLPEGLRSHVGTNDASNPKLTQLFKRMGIKL